MWSLHVFCLLACMSCKPVTTAQLQLHLFTHGHMSKVLQRRSHSCENRFPIVHRSSQMLSHEAPPVQSISPGGFQIARKLRGPSTGATRRQALFRAHPVHEEHDAQAGLKGVVRCVQHQPSAVPSKLLGGFNKEPMKQEAPAAAAEPVKYNQMAPPMTAYTAEYALAKASAAMDGNRQQVHTPSFRTGLRCLSVQPHLGLGQIMDTSLLPTGASARMKGSSWDVLT